MLKFYVDIGEKRIQNIQPLQDLGMSLIENDSKLNSEARWKFFQNMMELKLKEKIVLVKITKKLLIQWSNPGSCKQEIGSNEIQKYQSRLSNTQIKDKNN